VCLVIYGIGAGLQFLGGGDQLVVVLRDDGTIII
jgi:hypothetical protein